MEATQFEALLPLASKLERLASLTDRDRSLIRSLPFSLRPVPAAHHIVREGKAAPDCCLLVSGFACRHKLAANGGRQIVSFHLAGDMLDLQHLLLEVADHNVQTITEAEVAWIPKVELRRVARESPAIADALWRDTLIEASIFREWVLNVGRRDARSRIAHMLCEFAARCETAGLGSAESFELPMTQEQIADATGLTSVHVNRMLRALQEAGAIARDRRHLRILDWETMCSIADFHPAYLHAA
ncbi:MAG: Crp/Fnr family transcriptional regulator [Alphaproteobacteria bacterium]|nr:Crp/Fnr family transcriptional regulator [Alphaproteobacteria bacterium]MBV9372712.1 Crp/Fnr family transcriptional regulator [Alphaproteobacteria bacterium]MBV9900663.1 Crp/Fnr family transcriptional regulator [Alphaproteobacteria bacterium]